MARDGSDKQVIHDAFNLGNVLNYDTPSGPSLSLSLYFA